MTMEIVVDYPQGKTFVLTAFVKVNIFKLADLMRSIKTNGASKNRDSWVLGFL